MPPTNSIKEENTAKSTSDSNGDATTTSTRAITVDNKQMNDTDKFFVTYQDNEYEIHDFLDSHPAGKAILMPFRNRDITNKFNTVNHSDAARKILLKHKVNKTPEEIALLDKERGKGKASFNFEKLFTPEDPQFLHKFFGFLSLASFVYRYGYVFPTQGNLGMDGSWLDWVTLAIHFLLSFSSMIFHVIKHRIPERPLIIYEEYRLHAIVFTARACGVSVLGLVLQNVDIDILYKKIILAAFILTIHVLVDYITSVYGVKGVTAVRNNGVLSFKYIGLFYSYYQMAALAGHLVWDERLGDLGYNTLIAIQSSAFLMTLKRKNMIRWYSHAFWYSFALAMSYLVMWKTKGSAFFVYAATVFFFRAKFNLSKYILWPVYTLSMYYINSIQA